MTLQETPPWPDNADYVSDAEAEDEFNLDERPYQVMTPLDEDEYSTLRESIKKDGIRDPIHVDEYNNVLDGHHRVLAAREVGLWGQKEKEPAFVVHNTSGIEEKRRELAWELNMQQRHLDDGEKKDAIERRLKELDEQDDWQPNHEIAETLGVSSSWVREVRRRLEGSGNIRTTADISTDTDGRRTEADTKSKREQVKTALLEDPSRSDRSIARDFDVSHPFVGGVRDELGEPDIPPWWDQHAKTDAFWSYGVEGGVQVVAVHDASSDEWCLSLKSRQFYEDRGVEARGRNEGWSIARARSNSEIDAADIVENFAKSVDSFVRQKDEELREIGYEVEFSPERKEVGE
jgi:ParB-like chromosome segregation protein Spo0J